MSPDAAPRPEALRPKAKGPPAALRPASSHDSNPPAFHVVRRVLGPPPAGNPPGPPGLAEVENRIGPAPAENRLLTVSHISGRYEHPGQTQEPAPASAMNGEGNQILSGAKLSNMYRRFGDESQEPAPAPDMARPASEPDVDLVDLLNYAQAVEVPGPLPEVPATNDAPTRIVRAPCAGDSWEAHRQAVTGVKPGDVLPSLATPRASTTESPTLQESLEPTLQSASAGPPEDPRLLPVTAHVVKAPAVTAHVGDLSWPPRRPPSKSDPWNVMMQ